MPRFLVVEVVIFIHLIYGSNACKSLKKAIKGKDCVIPVGEKDGDFAQEPLFFDSDGRFLLPKVSQDGIKQLEIESGSSFFTSCSKSHVIEVKCSNSKLSNNDLSCSRSIQESVEEFTDTVCGPTNGAGKIAEIGWMTTSFQSQITVCHDREADHTYYTNHTIYGKNIDARSIGSRKPGFSESGFYEDISANGAYHRNHQKTLCPNNQCPYFYARGHLSPRADFIYKEWQDATYKYVNAVPQYDKFNGGNWANMEDKVREFAAKLGLSLQVQTGSYKNDSALLTQTKQIPVPKFMWKLVHDVQNNKAIVFVGVNSNKQVDENLCEQDPTTLCEDYMWSFPNRKKVKSGLMYCCKYATFKKKIPWIKDIKTSPGVLKF